MPVTKPTDVYLTKTFRGNPKGTHLLLVRHVHDSGYDCGLCILPDLVMRDRLKSADVKSLHEYMVEYPNAARADMLERSFTTFKPLLDEIVTEDEILSRKSQLHREIQNLEDLENAIAQQRPV